jgi:uncharacterized heparinase superfamily protein
MTNTMRLARTVTQLKPGQVSHRVRLRGQRVAMNSIPVSRRWLLAGPEPGTGDGWPAGYKPLDARVWRNWPGRTQLRDGAISLLGTTRHLSPAHDDTGHADTGHADRAGQAEHDPWAGADWDLADAPLLWRFHLYYWDWAWALAGQRSKPTARDLFATIWRSWQASVRPGQGPAWLPYPVALRAWSFCGLYHPLVKDSEIEDGFRAELAAQAGFLRRNLETDVGGNHLIKNLKALAGLAVFFGDDRLLADTVDRLTGQLAVQVLPDGGHYERAPAYHCQVLGDLIDVAGLLAATGQETPAELTGAIGSMRAWLGAVLGPDGVVPLLNDGFPVSRELVAALQPATPPTRPLHLLADTGLARATAGRWDLLADVGLPCPAELPAHAHADTLSCVVQVDAEPLLIDTGTSTYGAGPVRDHERSTAAHNTVEIDGENSTEVWGAFRAGRRARVDGLATAVSAEVVTIEADHDGYRMLRGRPRHHRRWSLSEHGLRVDDQITGRGRHQVVLRWHVTPSAQVTLRPGGATITTATAAFEVTVTADGQPDLTIIDSPVSAGYGRTVAAPVLVCTLHPELPVRISTVWRGPNPPEPPRS